MGKRSGDVFLGWRYVHEQNGSSGRRRRRRGGGGTVSTKIEWVINADGSMGRSWNPIRTERRDHGGAGEEAAGEQRGAAGGRGGGGGDAGTHPGRGCWSRRGDRPIECCGTGCGRHSR